MKLFSCPNATPADLPNPAAIPTPLGIVRLHATLNGHDIAATIPTATYCVSGDGRVVAWSLLDADIELLICRPLFAPPLDLPVTDCWGILWHIRALAPIESLVLFTTWDHGHSYQSGGSNSGQFLYGKTWESGRLQVSVGTQDDECLRRRSQTGGDLPSRWESHFAARQSQSDPKNDFWHHPIHNEVLETGVACPLPPMQAGQECRIQFGVACGSDDLAHTATSIAVEASPDQILAGAHCQ